MKEWISDPMFRLVWRWEFSCMCAILSPSSLRSHCLCQCFLLPALMRLNLQSFSFCQTLKLKCAEVYITSKYIHIHWQVDSTKCKHTAGFGKGLYTFHFNVWHKLVIGSIVILPELQQTNLSHKGKLTNKTRLSSVDSCLAEAKREGNLKSLFTVCQADVLPDS